MSLTQDAASDRRWAAARSIAEGVPPDRGRRRRHLVWLLISALIVGCLLLGVVLGALLPPLDTSPTEEDGWIARAVWAFAAQGIGVGIGVAGLIWAVRTGRIVTRRRAVAGPLNWRERKWALEQIRTATPIDDDLKRAVVLAMAAQNRQVALGWTPLMLGLTLVFVGSALATPWALIAWLHMALVVAVIVSSGFAARDYRRAGAYLDAFGGR
jgi:hypothetical protein